MHLPSVAMRRLLLRLALGGALGAVVAPRPAVAQGRYVPQAAAQRHFEDGERLQQAGDTLRAGGDADDAKGKYREAVDAFREAVEADPGWLDAYARLGLLYYQLEDSKAALPLLREAQSKGKDNLDVAFWLGQHELRGGDAAAGLKLLERVAAETERFPEAYVVLGNHYYNAKDYRRAQPAYEQYLRLRPGETTARAKLGNTYFKLKQYAQALAEFEAVLQADPDNLGALVNVGNAHFQLGQFDRAVQVLQQALKRDPGRASVLFNLAQSLFQLKRYDEAVGYYTQYIEQRPQSFNGRYFAGSALMELGRQQEAITQLQKAHELKPKVVHPLYKLGLIHLRAGRTDQAEGPLRKALALAKDEPWVLTALGTLARQRGRFDEAADLQRQAVKLAPARGRLHANLALTELRADRLEAAQAAIDEALKTEGDDDWVKGVATSVLAARARGLAQAGKAAEAEALVTRALALRPGPALQANRALLRLARADLDGARTDAAAAVAAALDLPAARYAEGRVALAAGELAQAIAALEAAHQKRPSAATATALGAARLRAGEVDAAVDALSTAAETWPDDAALATTLAVGRLLRVGERLARPITTRDNADLRAAVAAEDALPPLWAARARYASLVASLRRGDGNAARLHLSRLNALSRQSEGDVLAPSAPPRHIDYLTAHTNALLKQWDRVESLLSSMRTAKRGNTDEGRLLRQAYDQLGLSRLKAGDEASAVKLLKQAQAIDREADTENNLVVADWNRGRRRNAEKAWRALSGQVPEAIFNLAVAVEAKGKHREAWQLYRRYAATGGAHAAKAREVADAKQRIFGFGEEAP